MNLERIGAIEKVAAQEESRFTLQHLYFDAENGRLCATNGHALIVCECAAEDGDVSGLISVEAIQQYRKFRKENKLPNMVKFRALKDKLVVEDLTDGKVFSFRRPEGAYPTYASMIPFMPEGTPPSVTFNPKLLMEIAEAFPTEEYGGKAQSVSLWLLPEHAPRSKAQIEEAKQRGETVNGPSAILVRAHHQGGMALLMPTSYHLVGEDRWNTKLPGSPLKKADSADKPVDKPVEKKKPAPAHTPAPQKKPVTPAHAGNGVEKAARTM